MKTLKPSPDCFNHEKVINQPISHSRHLLIYQNIMLLASRWRCASSCGEVGDAQGVDADKHVRLSFT
jgi:hypothetical protein